MTPEPFVGRQVIRATCRTEFGRASMTCLVDALFEDGEWAMFVNPTRRCAVHRPASAG